jgi:hypothetical protein
MTTLQWIWVAGGGVVALLIILILLLRRAPPARASHRPSFDDLDTVSSWRPQSTRMLSTHERVAHGTLMRAVPEMLVFAQVPLSRFLKVPTRYSYSEWMRRVGNQCADLVVCDPSTEVVAVIDVRGVKQPASPRAQQRAERLARVLRAAGIPLHVWSANALPTVEQVRAALIREPEDDGAPDTLPQMPPASRSESAARANAAPFSDSEVDQLSPDEIIEMREPHSSTWFDNLDSRGTPLDTKGAKPGKPDGTPR